MLVLVQLFFRDDIERMRVQCKLTCKTELPYDPHSHDRATFPPKRIT